MTAQEFNILLDKWLKEEMTSAEADNFIAVVKQRQYHELVGDAVEADLLSRGFFRIKH